MTVYMRGKDEWRASGVSEAAQLFFGKVFPNFSFEIDAFGKMPSEYEAKINSKRV